MYSIVVELCYLSRLHMIRVWLLFSAGNITAKFSVSKRLLLLGLMELFFFVYGH